MTELCEVLGVPESSYYYWASTGRAAHDARDAAREQLCAQIRDVWDSSTETYGAPRVHAELRDAGIVVSRRRVAEVMAAAGIRGLSGREHTTTTTRPAWSRPLPNDRAQRRFKRHVPNELWYGDVTYLYVGGRFWYLATVIDAATKECVGWSFKPHMRTELVTHALNRAARRRNYDTNGTVFHSDRGSQYTSDEHRAACARHGIIPSVGATGVCWDNAAAESFFATMKRELVNRYRWNSPKQLEQAIAIWIEGWYNTRRRHSANNYRTPRAEYEYLTTKQAA